MKIVERRLRSNSSGQLLLVAALAIAILISSTTMYVYELSKETNRSDSKSISNFILAIKQSTRNAMISSLANASNGGQNTVLAASLNELSQVFKSLNHFGICDLGFTLLNDSRYDSGVRLFWGTSGIGVSSVYANFTLKVYGMMSNATADYAVNVTTAVTVDGYYAKLTGDEKLINLTCAIQSEGEPALARNIGLFYERLGIWTPVNSSNNLSMMDYGNGTYQMSFTADIPSDSVSVSVHVYDLRDIFVQVNTTCYEG